MKQATRQTLVAVVVFGTVVTAWAQTARPDRSIRYRQGVMTAQYWQVLALDPIAKGQKPYHKDEVLQRAINLDSLAKMPWEGFGPGTDTGAKHRAKPEVWSEPAKFKQGQEALQAETAKLVSVAQNGNADQFKQQFAAVNKACDSCHDTFQSK